MSIAGILLYVVLTASEIRFQNSSNFATSGGFGPNQVSTALGMGFVVAVLLLVSVKELPAVVRATLLIITLWLFIQTILTFSRGGITVAMITLGIVYIYRVLVSPEIHLKNIMAFIMILTVSLFFVCLL